jgi:hypothetical protein
MCLPDYSVCESDRNGFLKKVDEKIERRKLIFERKQKNRKFKTKTLDAAAGRGSTMAPSVLSQTRAISRYLGKNIRTARRGGSGKAGHQSGTCL